MLCAGARASITSHQAAQATLKREFTSLPCGGRSRTDGRGDARQSWPRVTWGPAGFAGLVLRCGWCGNGAPTRGVNGLGVAGLSRVLHRRPRAGLGAAIGHVWRRPVKPEGGSRVPSPGPYAYPLWGLRRERLPPHLPLSTRPRPLLLQPHGGAPHSHLGQQERGAQPGDGAPCTHAARIISRARRGGRARVRPAPPAAKTAHAPRSHAPRSR